MEGRADYRAGNKEKLEPKAEIFSSTVERRGREGVGATGVDAGLAGLDKASATAFSAPEM